MTSRKLLHRCGFQNKLFVQPFREGMLVDLQHHKVLDAHISINSDHLHVHTAGLIQY